MYRHFLLNMARSPAEPQRSNAQKTPKSPAVPQAHKVRTCNKIGACQIDPKKQTVKLPSPASALSIFL